MTRVHAIPSLRLTSHRDGNTFYESLTQLDEFKSVPPMGLPRNQSNYDSVAFFGKEVAIDPCFKARFLCRSCRHRIQDADVAAFSNVIGIYLLRAKFLF